MPDLHSNSSYWQDHEKCSGDLYVMPLSSGTPNAVTGELLSEWQAWRERDLEAVYPIVWLDAIHCKIKKMAAISSRMCPS